MSFKRGAQLIVLVALCVAVGASSAPAWAAVEGAGWELSAHTDPTNLIPGVVDEVQEIVPSPEEATFTLTFEEHETVAIPVGASASAVQTTLEALPSIGAGNVAVTEEAGTPGVYTVTFVGALANMQVARLGASGATVSVKTTGLTSGMIAIDVFNIGAAASNGTITVTDTLPAGVRAKEAGQLTAVYGHNFGRDNSDIRRGGVWDCTGNGPGSPPNVAGASVVTCTNDPVGLPFFAGGGGMPTANSNEVVANPQPQVGIAVEAGGEASGLTNRVSIAGGGALESASAEDAVTVSSAPADGGVVSADAWFSNADGTIDTQAGSHPYTATFVFNLATALNAEQQGYAVGGELRELETRIPSGLVGDLHNMPQCRRSELLLEQCPPSSMVGALAAETFLLPGERPVFNMVPAAGEPAELSFMLSGYRVPITFSVQTGSDYAIVAHVHDVPQTETYQSILTLWGVPEDTSHNRWRGDEGGCTKQQMEESDFELFGDSVNYCVRPQRPILHSILTLPTSCGEPQRFAFRDLGSWDEPNAISEVSFLTHDDGGAVGFTGCEALGIEPAITTTPDTPRADAPAGLTVEVKPPVGGLEEPGALASADIQDATVTLPEGVVVNPGQAAGLQVCGSAEDALTSDAERVRGEEDTSAPSCPASSRVGTVTIHSPVIESAVEKQFDGSVYVLASNPPELKLLVAASADGVNLKLVGTVHLNEQTGRLETTFRDTPQLPFSDLKLSFNGGPQAALLTPRACGVFTTTSDFTPWSAPFAPDAFPTAQFAVQEGVGGGACPNGEPFAPSMAAGMVNNQAGAFSALSVTLSRQDQEQDVSGVSVTTPQGLLAILKSVERCPEPQAGQGTCGQGSLIGHTTVAVGAGPDPLYVQGGQVFLTGPYRGAPFGLSVVVPAVAGPFNLGNVIVRAAISIDPHTAQPTIVSDPLPTILDGVPLQVKTVNITIDRAGFMFNPTDCEPLAVTGTITSIHGVQAQLANHFQAANCTTLSFHPVFTVSTQAKTSKKSGASLTVKGSFPAGEANIHSVAVTLPKQLPARLTTIQQACLAATFNANPANCPAGSDIGVGTASTPILANAISGPAYLVSHGGAAFPDVVVILQGEGVTVDLTGSINIKHNITSSTFATVPDAPISTFQLTLPEGPHSGLGAVVPAKAKGSLCGQKLAMPFTITAQNGAQLKQNVKIAVTGCPKAKKKTVKKKHTRRAHGRKAKHRR